MGSILLDYLLPFLFLTNHILFHSASSSSHSLMFSTYPLYFSFSFLLDIDAVWLSDPVRIVKLGNWVYLDQNESERSFKKPCCESDTAKGCHGARDGVCLPYGDVEGKGGEEGSVDGGDNLRDISVDEDCDSYINKSVSCYRYNFSFIRLFPHLFFIFLNPPPHLHAYRNRRVAVHLPGRPFP